MQHTDTTAGTERLAGRRIATGPILVASDGGPASDSALEVTRLLVAHTGAVVNVVSALEPSNAIVPPIEPPAAPLRRGASRVEERRARLDALARGAGVDSLRWPVEIVLGDRVRSIAQEIAARGAQLVVTGRAHHGAVERIVRRETPLGIVREGYVPVLAVPANMKQLPRRVVVAVGLGDAGARVGDLAGLLFRDAVVVHLVHVRAPALPRHERALREEAEADDRSVVHAFARAREAWRLPADVSTVTHVLVGRPADELLTFAGTVEADLLVVGLGVTVGVPLRPRRALAPRLYRAWPHAMLLAPTGDTARRRTSAGTRVSVEERSWPVLLEQVAHRNAQRATTLEMDEGIGGIQLIASHEPLAGIAYDRHARAVVVTVGDPSDPRAHLTHQVPGATAIAVHHDESGRDDTLVIGYDGGQLLLTFE